MLSGMEIRTGCQCLGQWSSLARVGDPVTGNRFKIFRLTVPHILAKVQRQELCAAVQPAVGEGGHPNEEKRREGRFQWDSCTADCQPACTRENCRAENHLRWNYINILLTQKILRKRTSWDSQAWRADAVAEFWRHVWGAAWGGYEGGGGGGGRGRC